MNFESTGCTHAFPRICFQHAAPMIESALLGVFPLALIYAALRDVGTFVIPNWLTGGLALLFVPLALIAGMGFQDFGFHAAVGAGALIAGMAAFAFRAAGGGDAKLFAAAALWLGPSAFLSFFVVMAFAGGLLGIALMGFRRWPLPASLSEVNWVLRLHSSAQGIPYGLAIAIGGVAAFPMSQLFVALSAG